QEFSLLAHIKIDPPEELFPGDAFVNQLFRSLQYRIAVEVKPDHALKILEAWDKETKPYEPRQSYLLSRLMLATEILKYNQGQLPAKKLIGYLKEMIDIKDSDKEIWEEYLNSMGRLEEYNIKKSNFFSFLFSFIYARPPIYAPFLIDLIDALDELQPEIRTLLLADFGENSIEAQLLISGVWLAEANLENPDWKKCLTAFDKVIERTTAWGYPHITAALAKGKAIIHDEYLNNSDTAHEILQENISKVGALPVLEEAQAMVYFRQERYQEALHIYENILPKWDPPSEQLNIGPLEEYRRAAICAAHLDDWKKAAIFLEEGAKKTQKIENTDKYIGLYADAGFANFKADNMLDSIKLLNLALEKFETLPQNNSDLNYFTLKKRLNCVIKWIWVACYGSQNLSSEHVEPSAGFCSNQETNEEVLNLPDSPIEYTWLYLAQIEYNLEHETTILEHALQVTTPETHPDINFFLSILKTQYDFRNKTFNELPKRIQQLANACDSIQKHLQNGKGIGEEGIDLIPITNLPIFTSVENIIVILVASLLIQKSTDIDTHEILAIWRASSSELAIKENIFFALDQIESMLLTDQNQALTVMKTRNVDDVKLLTAAFKVIENKETNTENLFHAHIFISTSLIKNLTWLDPVMTSLAEMLSAQWLEKIKSGAMLQMNVNILQEIEQACTSSETGKKKIGQILLAAYQVVSTIMTSDTIQLLQSWTADP
ncbi:MAG: tetratricopeptide repeat protein, partial [Candidatus Poribacteria bacterium]|nr:tetratricopeptide repeat protein [Candidatus Poribacteria bacterium]